MLLVEENSPYGEAYTSLSKNRIVFLSEDVTKEMAATFNSLLIYYNSIDPEQEIKILINTSGGDASALSSMYDVMQMVQCPISTVGIGKVYSAGAFILAAGTKGRRFMFKNSEVLIHGLQCSFPEIPVSDQIDAANYFSYLEKFNKKIMGILAKHTGQPLTKLLAGSERDLYLNATEAKKFGLIDQVLQ